jgi:hypothetical protein
VEFLAGHKKSKPKPEPEKTGTEPEKTENSVFGHQLGLGHGITEILSGCSVVARQKPIRPK